MALKKLYIFVEGNDDVLFFSSLITPLLLKIYNDVELIQFAQLKREKANQFLKSIIALGFDYIIVTDMDEEVTLQHKKKKILLRFEAASLNKITVVITEIESWFISGLPYEKAIEWQIPFFERTELITKEEFNKLYGRRFHSRIDFMQELIKYYNYEIAASKNSSFEFFYKTYLHN